MLAGSISGSSASNALEFDNSSSSLVINGGSFSSDDIYLSGGNISGGSVNEFVQIYGDTQVYANGPSSSETSPSFETVEECCYLCATHRSGTVTCPSGYSTINTVITGGTYSGGIIKGGKFGGSFRLCSGTPPSSNCGYTNYRTYSTSCDYFCFGPKWCSYKKADPYPTQKSYTSGSYGC